MSNATPAITKLLDDKNPAATVAALDGYIAEILKQLAHGTLSETQAHRDLDEAYGYKALFIEEASK